MAAVLPAPLSMGGVAPNPAMASAHMPIPKGNFMPVSPRLDAHQLHLQHLNDIGSKPPLDAHQLHMQHLKSIGQDPNAINQYLTNDPTYQQQTTAIQKALGDYQAQNLQQQNSYNSGYALNKANLDEQNRQSGINQGEDYGSRGMLRSGLYAVDNTDRLNSFAQQQAQLDQSRGDYMMNSQQGLNNYMTQEQLAGQQARQDAINRRALGLIGTNPPVVR